MSSPSQASLVLIATASILIDRITRHHVAIERLKCQILLWLTLAVSQKDLGWTEDTATSATQQEVFETWLHAVFFCNIVSIVADDEREKTAEFSLSLLKQHIPLDLLSLSSWVSLMAFTIKSRSSSWHPNHHDSVMFTLKIFIISFGGFWALKWYWRRKATIALDVPMISGILPATQYSHPSQHQPPHGIGIELSRWYEWNVKQTWTWITAVFEKSRSANEAQTILRLLEPHMLQGNILDGLTIQHLVQMMNLPYGPAMHLFKEIDSLKQIYPNPNSAGVGGFDTSSFSNVQRRADWLTMHDQEYNNWSLPDNLRDQTEFSTSRVRSNPLPPMDPTQEARLSQIMKERYGLHLPTVQVSGPGTDDHTTTGAGVTSSDSMRPATGSLQAYGGNSTRLPTNPLGQNYSMHPPQSGHVLDSHHPDSSVDIPPSNALSVSSSLLDQMPPRIREIAERRPDLVHHLLAKKASPIPSSTGRNSGDATRRIHAKELLPVVGEEEGGGSDDEMASLIQRRPRP